MTNYGFFLSFQKIKIFDIGTQSMSLLIIANFPHSPSQDAPLYEAAQEIEYLEKVILETLRLNSPAGKWVLLYSTLFETYII